MEQVTSLPFLIKNLINKLIYLPVFVVLGFELRALPMLDNYLTTALYT